MTIILWRICAAALLFHAAGVSAQTLYRQAGDAGRIAVSEQPDTAPPPQNVRASGADVASALVRRSAISSRHSRLIDTNEAARSLRQARLDRAQGMRPLASEQVQGTDVVNHRYWRRQEKLRQAAEQAQRRLKLVSRSP